MTHSDLSSKSRGMPLSGVARISLRTLIGRSQSLILFTLREQWDGQT